MSQDADSLYTLCRSLPGVTEDVKWEDNLVFSVAEKMFVLFALPDGDSLAFKAEPEVFEELVKLPHIEPSPYLARYSWIRLERRDALPEEAVEELLRESYRLVASKLPKKRRVELGLA